FEPSNGSAGEAKRVEDNRVTFGSVVSALEDLEGSENVDLYFTGHTDNVPVGKPETLAKYGTNTRLSRARAEEAKARVREELEALKFAVGDCPYAQGGSNDCPDVEAGASGHSADAVGLCTCGKGESSPIADNRSEDGREHNRRVEIDTRYEKVTQIARMVAQPACFVDDNLPGAGLIRVTQDPAIIDPRLSVIADQPLRLRDNRLLSGINFHLYTNYARYIERAELLIYSAADKDLVTPLKTFALDYFALGEPLRWDVSDAQSVALEVGDEDLIYVLRVHGALSHQRDQTVPRVLRVIEVDEEDHIPKANEPLQIYGESNLARQTIPIDGARVRIHGKDFDTDYQVSINGLPVLLDENGKFAFEEYMAAGEQKLEISTYKGSGESCSGEMKVDVLADYMFMVGLANLTVGQNDVSGNIEPLSVDDHFDGDTFTDGRVAFYLKGRIRGKYLLTAQLDSTEDDLNDLGDNLKRKDPQSVFRRLDPDAFYPVYGDSSTTSSDVDTQGAYYVRLDWDQSQALWGNYHTGVTGNEFAQYNRSLYGARLVYKTLSTNKYGDHDFEVTGFGSEPLTAQAHNSFAATGGSLYYLRDTDIVEGSEKVWIEVRTRDTEQVINNITLHAGRDYEIDYLQGRVILRQPLSQVALSLAPEIIKDSPLEGDDVFLRVDYEFVPPAFSDDELTAGGRAHIWLNDNFGIGGTYIEEGRTATDYELKGVDATVRLGGGTYLKGEFAESDNRQTNAGFLSSDGGLNFGAQTPPAGFNSSGEAYGGELRLNLNEVSSSEGLLKGWWKQREAGFSASQRLSEGVETTDMGAEGEWRPTEKLALAGRYTDLERVGVNQRRTGSLQADYDVTNKLTLGGEVRREETDVSNTPAVDTEATLAGGRLSYELEPETEIYVEGQGVLDDKGPYQDNNLGTIGLNRRANDRFAWGTEISAGDRGEALIGKLDYAFDNNVALNLSAGVGDGAASSVGANYRSANGYELYGTYSMDPDRTTGDKNTLTLGQRSDFGDSLKVYTEHRFTEAPSEAGVGQVFGLDYNWTEFWHVGLSLQLSSLEDALGQDTDRTTTTAGVHYTGHDIKGSSTLEYRQDDGARDTTQWLTTNALDWRRDPNLGWLGKISLSFTEDDLSGNDEAKFAEVDLGAAYRPVFADQLNMLFKYTYLYDLPSLGQATTRPDERAHILAIDGLYDLSRRWEVGGKLAYKQNELRLARDSGPWFDSNARLAVARARYHFIRSWDGLLEYRWLDVRAADDDRQGVLLGIYRHIGDHVKLGAGYNFTDFNDDLSSLDYRNRGWFVDLLGKW
ncbi:MAG: hypothetical protein ACR2RB_17660, partial [Gammaproteobacteria bacterium]